MSLLPVMNRLSYDDATYRQNLKQSVTPGEYTLATFAATHCGRCVMADPSIANMGAGSAPSCANGMSEVDVESDLLNLPRPATNAPSGKYRGDGGPPTVCGGAPSSAAARLLTSPGVCDGMTSVDTRLTVPTCTLRGTGWNRFEWLCRDPQEQALLPFDALINTGILMKDNHRPHLAQPIDQTMALPPSASRCVKPINALSIPCGDQGSREGPDGETPQIMWRTCAEVDRIRNGCRGA